MDFFNQEWVKFVGFGGFLALAGWVGWFIRGLSQLRYRPCLDISTTLAIVDQVNTVGIQDLPAAPLRCVRLAMHNLPGRDPIRNCRAELIATQDVLADGRLGPNQMHDRRPVRWEGLNTNTAADFTYDLHSDDVRRLDVIFASAAESFLRFRVHPFYTLPRNRRYVLTIRVTADNVPNPPLVYVLVECTGPFDNLRACRADHAGRPLPNCELSGVLLPFVAG